MPSYHCPRCGRTWPENYCPTCKSTIERVPVRSTPLSALSPVPKRPDRFPDSRCPACGQSPGRSNDPSFCGQCGIRLRKGPADRALALPPERAERVVATLRKCHWVLRGAAALLLAIGLVLIWLVPDGPAGTAFTGGLGPLLFLVLLMLVPRIYRCPECQGRISRYGPEHYCMHCGVPHDRQGLEGRRRAS